MIAFEDRGDGPAVTFIHGFGLDGRVWEPQVRALEGTHRTLAVNLPGFGPAGAADSGVHSPAQAVLEVLDARGVERTHLVGHSFGGAVAVDLALAHPARLLSLTLVDALLLGRAAGIASWSTCVEMAQKGRNDEARRAWLGDALFEPARRHPDALRSLEQIVADYACGHWAGRVSNRWLVDDAASRLGDLRTPTLVVRGELDTKNFHAMADEYIERVPGARGVMIPGAGHMCPIEAPAAFNDALRWLP